MKLFGGSFGWKAPLLLAVLAAAAMVAWRPGFLLSQTGGGETLLDPGDIASVRVLFGAGDTEPSTWDGSLSVSGGELIGIRDWHPRPENEISRTSWKLKTTWGPNFRMRPVEEDPLTEPERYLRVPGIIVDVRGSSGASVEVRTPHGAFQIAPFTLPAGRSRRELNGRVAVDRVPFAQSLSSGDYEDGEPVVAELGDGGLAVAWVAFRDNGNAIYWRRFEGGRWSAPEKLSGSHSDIFLVKLARVQGALLAVWSAQVDGNWDLYARRFAAGSWSAAERLTEDPQPDVYHNLATDSNGRAWLVWQGFRNGQSDVLARRWEEWQWSAPEVVSASQANDWAPAVAADGAGTVYVAWDSYGAGNYDVLLRQYSGGQWSEVTPVADTPKFEANVSLACDREDRLWAAWNESGFQWGKDFGFLVRKQSTPLYLTRPMAVAVHSGGQWREPVQAIEDGLPVEMRGYNDLPVLQSDAAGRMWVFFRHRVNRFPDTPRTSINHRAAWEVWGTAYDGQAWTEPVCLPFSQGRTDMRSGFTLTGAGDLYAAYPTDNRDFEQYLFAHADVHLGLIPRIAGAAAAPKLQPRRQPKLTTYATHEDEAGDLARIRSYAIESGGRTYRIYRGDTHRHTEISFDGNNDGSLLDAYRYALDAGALDYLLTSDHRRLQGPDVPYVNWMLSQMADVFHVSGAFVPFFGYERSLSFPNGHRNILYAKRGNAPFQASPAENAGKEGAGKLFEHLRATGGISIPHTSATNMGTDWRDNDPEVEPLVEIYQGDRVSAEYEGAPKAAYAGDPTVQAGGFRPEGYVWNAWAKGYKLGVQASSDHLSTHISYACTIATEFTREGLISAMRQRHNYAATDNIILDYRLRAGGKEYLQGDIAGEGGDVRLLVKAIGTRPIRQVDIIKNNRFIHTGHPLAKEVDFTFADKAEEAGESYYYVRVIQVDDQIAWSSPIWVNAR